MFPASKSVSTFIVATIIDIALVHLPLWTARCLSAWIGRSLTVGRCQPIKVVRFQWDCVIRKATEENGASLCRSPDLEISTEHMCSSSYARKWNLRAREYFFVFLSKALLDNAIVLVVGVPNMILSRQIVVGAKSNSLVFWLALIQLTTNVAVMQYSKMCLTISSLIYVHDSHV